MARLSRPLKTAFWDDDKVCRLSRDARLVGPGRFSIAESVDVPGCGRTTPTVLVFEAPATRNRRSWVGAVA